MHYQRVDRKLTPRERGMDGSYSGKLATYGEEILGYLRTGSNWHEGWTTLAACCLVGQDNAR